MGRGASADCGDLGRMGVGTGALFGTLPSILVGTFAAPGIAVAVDGSLNYWPGVGWAALGAVVGGGLGTLPVYGSCPYPESLYVPGVAALAGATIATTIYGLTTRKPEKKVSDGARYELKLSAGGVAGSGGQLVLAGRF